MAELLSWCHGRYDAKQPLGCKIGGGHQKQYFKQAGAAKNYDTS